MSLQVVGNTQGHFLCVTHTSPPSPDDHSLNGRGRPVVNTSACDLYLGLFFSSMPPILHFLNIAHSNVLYAARDRAVRRCHALDMSPTMYGRHSRGFTRSVRRILSAQTWLADGSCARAIPPCGQTIDHAISMHEARAADSPGAAGRSSACSSSCC